MRVFESTKVGWSAAASKRKSDLVGRIGVKFSGFQAPFSERRVLLLLGDGLALLGASLLGQQAVGYQFDASSVLSAHWYWLAIVFVGWGVLGWLNDIYDISSSYDKFLIMRRVLTVGALGLIIYFAVDLLDSDNTPPRFILASIFLSVFAVILWRFAYAHLSSFIFGKYRVLIVGQGERARSVAQMLEQNTKLNYQLLGCLTESEVLRASKPSANDLPVLGRAADLVRLAKQLRIREVVVATEHNLEVDLFQQLVECQAKGMRVSRLPTLYEKLYRRVPIEYIDPAWALNLLENRAILNRLQLASKRLLDLVVMVFALPLFLLLLPLVALAIRVDTPGPVFYHQIRSGRGGKPFRIKKFRTMVVDAENDGHARWATDDDPRITRVGRFLRRSRLDELPQLINVFRSEMSFIGPRPERPEIISELLKTIPFYYTRLLVKPGLTGWAQIHRGYGNTTQDTLVKLQYDFYYLRYWSLRLDLYIIFWTFRVMLTFGGT